MHTMWSENQDGKHYYEMILSRNGQVTAEGNNGAAVHLYKPEMGCFNEVKGQQTKTACGHITRRLFDVTI